MHERSRSEGRKVRHREADRLSGAPLVHRPLSPCKGTIKGPDERKPKGIISILGGVGGAGAPGTRATASALLGTSNHTDRIWL